MSGRIVRRIVVRGRVQGVGYRDWTRRAAKDRGIEGWVRNRRDGSVEAVLAGPAPAVAAMIEACRRGPPSAAVTSIEEHDATGTDLAPPGGEGFALLPTV